MQIKVLGCSGGIGGQARTTSFLVDEDILIDAGTGVADLDLDALGKIDHVFLTHSHLDHVACLPLMLDSVGNQRNKPVTVHARPATLQTLRDHIFNWKVWPDFSTVPEGNPYLVFEELAPDGRIDIDGRNIRSVPVEHTVPAVGYIVENSGGTWAFSGDTTTTDKFWSVLNDEYKSLKYLVMETTFTDEERELTELSKHLCPELAAVELAKLKHKPEIFITHLMPSDVDGILEQLYHHLPKHHFRALRAGHVFHL